MSKFILIFICLIFGLFISCTHQESNSNLSLNIEQSVKFSDSFNVIQIQNNNNQAVSFHLRINNSFPLEMSDIILSIEDSSKIKNTSLEEEAWKYVSRSTFWSTPYSLENWQHNPVLFLNSIGGGYCDDRASVLAFIWKNWFDSVRIVGLNGHVVSEVYSNNKWKMYDADRMVAYLNAKNEICSVSELEDSSQFISSPSLERVIGPNPIFHTKNAYSYRFSKFYSSKKDNKNETEWHLKSNKNNSTFILPAYSSLKIEIDRETHQVNLTVHLSEKSKGELQIPFVPYSAKGDFKYQIDTKLFWVKDSKYIFPTNKWLNSLHIENVKSKSTIHYLVNPKLKFFQPENILKIKSSLPMLITKNHENVIPYLPYEFESGLFFDMKYEEYNEFLVYLSKFNGKINEDFLTKQYDYFLSIDSSLSTKNKLELQLLFKKDYDALNLNRHGKEYALMVNLYPASVFHFFIASKYRKLNFAKSLIQNEN